MSKRRSSAEQSKADYPRSLRCVIWSTSTLLFNGVLTSNMIASASSVAACEVLLTNSSFDQPTINSTPPTPRQVFQSGTIAAHNENDVPGWSSSADNFIELWRNGNTVSESVPVYEGEQFAEINAYVDGSLFQDVVTTLGSVPTWQFAHRGRFGPDILNLKIGQVGATVEQINPATGSTSFTNNNTGESLR